MFNKRNRIFSIFVTITFLIVVVCILFKSPYYFGDDQEVSMSEVSGEEEITYQIIEALLVDYSVLDDLTKDSTLVIKGVVESASKPFTIKPVGGGDASNFVDYYVKPLEVFRGETGLELITVRIQGGLVGDVYTIVDYEPELSVGDEFLLFLYQPPTGGGYNTEGDYYYVTGHEQGAFSLSSTKYYSAQNSYSKTALESAVVAYDANNPVNLEEFRESSFEGLDYNLKTGFISKEEYESAIEVFSQYAIIVRQEG